MCLFICAIIIDKKDIMGLKENTKGLFGGLGGRKR